jgi:hypothetical protein
MTVNATQLRSLIGPVWQEISSLWSGVDFPFSDPLPEPAEPLEQALFPMTKYPVVNLGGGAQTLVINMNGEAVPIEV